MKARLKEYFFHSFAKKSIRVRTIRIRLGILKHAFKYRLKYCVGYSSSTNLRQIPAFSLENT